MIYSGGRAILRGGAGQGERLATRERGHDLRPADGDVARGGAGHDSRRLGGPLLDRGVVSAAERDPAAHGAAKQVGADPSAKCFVIRGAIASVDSIMRRVSCVLLPLLISGSCKAAVPTLRAAPVVPSRGPFATFQVECRNDSSQPIERVNAVSALRFDGHIQEPGFVGSFLGGPPAPIPGHSTWSETVSLMPISPPVSSSGGRAFRVSLEPGRHTVAFRCAGLWSDVVQFYWSP